ncbi:MAG: ribose 5-phosphate isomerase B [Bacteroidetes bacterium]|nr:ribose 5-phosphate isomerase B [Bacteroidota bacterium]
MQMPQKIAIGCDHAGYQLKESIKEHLKSLDVEVIDCGTDSPDSVDYPDFAHAVADTLSSGEALFGILICGTANGIAMSANKHSHIRAAIAWCENIAEMARLHNNANILCLPARVIATPLALSCVDTFMTTDFEGGRHGRRVGKMSPC